MPPPGRPPSRHLPTTSEKLPLRSVTKAVKTGGTVGCPKGYGLPTPSTSPTARSVPCKLPLEEKTTSNTDPCFSTKPQKQKRERSCFVDLPFSLSQVHPDDVRDKVFVAILKALIKLENQPSSPRELSNCILQNRYVVLGGNTPYATVSSRISQHFKRATEARPPRRPLLAKAVDDSHARKLRYYLNPDAGLPHVPPPKLRESERPLAEPMSSTPGNVTPNVARKRAAKDFFASDKKPCPAQKKRKGTLGRLVGSRNGINSKSRFASSSPSVAGPSTEYLRRSRSETFASASPTPEDTMDMSHAIYSDASLSETEDDTWRPANSSGGKSKPSSPSFHTELTEIKEESPYLSSSRNATPKLSDPEPILVSPPRGHVALRHPSCEPETEVFASRIKLEDCHDLASMDGMPTLQIRRRSLIPGLEVSDYSSEMMKTDLLALDSNGSQCAPVPETLDDSPRDDAPNDTPLTEDCMLTPHGTQAGSGRNVSSQNGKDEEDDVLTCPLSSASSASSLPTPVSLSCRDNAVICQDTPAVSSQTIHFNNLQLYRNDPTLAPPISGLLSPRLAPTADISVRILGPTSPLLLFSPRSTSIYGDLDEGGMLTTTDISGGLDLPLPASVCSPELAKLNFCPEVGKYHSYIPLPEPNHPETVTVGELDRLLDSRNSGCHSGLSYIYNSGSGRLRTPRRLHPPSTHNSHSLANSGMGLGLGLGLSIGNHISCCTISPLTAPMASPLRISHKPPHPRRNHHPLETVTVAEAGATCGQATERAEKGTGEITEELKEETEERKEGTEENKEEMEERNEAIRLEELEERKEETEEKKEIDVRKVDTETGVTTPPAGTEDRVLDFDDLGTPSTADSGEIEEGSEAVRRPTKGTSTSTGGSGSGSVVKSSGSAPTTRSATASRRGPTTRLMNAGSAGDDDEDERKRSRTGRTLGRKGGKRRRRRREEEESEEEEEGDEEADREGAEQEKGSDLEAAKETDQEKEPAQGESTQSEENAVKDSGKKPRGITDSAVSKVEKGGEKVGGDEGNETENFPSVEPGESTRDLVTNMVDVRAETEMEATAPNDEVEDKTRNREEQVETLPLPNEAIRQPIPEDLPFSYSPVSPTRSHRERKEARARRNAAMTQRRTSLVAQELAAAKVALAALESTVAIQESSESESDYESESNSDKNGEAVRTAKESQTTENAVGGDDGEQRPMKESTESAFGAESSSFASAVMGLVDLSAAGNSSRHRSIHDSRVLAGIVIPGSVEAEVEAAATAGTVSSLTAEGAVARIPSVLPPSMPAPPAIPTRIPTNPTIYLTLIDSIPVYVTHITRTMMPASSDEEDENHRRHMTTVPSSASGGDAHNLHASGAKNGAEPPVHVTFKLLRRVDSGYVNATTLLEAGGMDTEQERSIVLSLEVGRIRVRKQGSELYGTWIPLPRGRALAATCSLQHRLGPFLNDNLDSYFPSPLPIAPSPLATSPSVMDPVASHHLLASTGHKESTFRRAALRTAIGSQNPMLGETPRLAVNAAPSTEEKDGVAAGIKPTKGIKTSTGRSGEGGGNSDEDTDTDTEVTEIRRRRDLGLEPLIRRPPPGNHRRRRASTSGGTAGPARKKRIFIVHGGTGETGGLVPLALAPARRKPYYTHSSIGDESSEHEGEEGEEGGETIKNKGSTKGSTLGSGRKRPASGPSGRNKKVGKAAGDVKSTGSGASTSTTTGRRRHSRQNSTTNFPVDDESETNSSSSSDSDVGLKRARITKKLDMPSTPSMVEETTKKSARKVVGGLLTKKKKEGEKKKKKGKGGLKIAGKGGSQEEESELDIGGSDGDDDLR